MAKTKRSILMLLACVFLFSVAALIFTACSTPSYTVTFLVQNDATDEWEQYATETSEEGVVTLPNNPTKTDYVFRNWYDNTDFTGDPFTGENVEGDMNVYAYFVPTEISINVTKSEDDVDEDTVYVRDLETLKEQYEAEALAANLTFDGWYTGADYDTLWTSSSDVDVVYGRFMAQIVYDNGFETYEPFTVQAGTTISEPTLEYIQKSYMDDEDIYYVVGDDYQIYNDNGVVTGYDEYDFSQPVTENMTITVLWKTPYLLYNVNANGTYTIAGIGANLYGINKNTEIQDYLNSLPVISLPAYVTASDDVDGVFFTNPGAVESIEMHQSLNSSSYYLASVQKVIVQEGIKWIYGIKGSSTVEEVVLPSTLKGMERSLNNLTGLQSVTIPDGVEVIINSLWYSDVTSKQNTTYESYDFNIEIPASVKNMAMMPAKNLTFAEGSPFFIEDNALYLRKGEDDLVLINSYNVENGELHVKESVTGIQVGAFFYNKDVDYVYLPSTFAYMNENELHTTYPYALSSYKSNARSTTVGGSYLDCTNFTYGSVRESQSSGGIMLYDNLGDDEILTFIFNTTSYPSTLDDDAFCDGKTSWTAYPNANYVIFVGNATADEDVTVSLTAYNASTQQSQYITFTQKTGTQLTSNAILKALQDAEKASSLSVTSVTYLGNTYALPAELTGNVYLDVEYVYTENGFTYTIENDEAIVTGLSGSAIKLSSGYYYVNITSTVTDNAIEYPVTEIADEAFMGDAVGIVNIANSVKKIGNSAFENCVNLTSVTIAPGGLEYIGDHAFEDTAFTTITLPLANVTYIGPYAFKSAALQRFIPAEGESYIGTLEITASSTEMKVGKYYLYNGGYNNYDDDYVCFIIRYTGVGTEYSATYSNQSEKTTDVTVYDVDLVAIAGGMRCRTLNLGVSGRARFNRTYVIRYSVQEGSVYYLSDSRMTSIVFGIVKNVEQNAFTDIDEKFWVTTESGTYKGKVYRYEMTNESFDVYDCWLTQAQVAGIASKDYNFSAADAIFEDGWFNGITVEDESYETTMRFISDTYLGVYSSMLAVS